MKSEIYKTEFATYYLDESASYLEQYWTNPDEKMLLDDYKNDMLNYLKHVTQYKTERVLINLQLFNFLIVPETQEWVDKNIAIEANKIVKKIAFVLPDELLVKLSVEQTMDEQENAKYESIRYFDNAEQAGKCLLQ